MNISTDLIKTSSAISPEILEILLGWEKESDLEERNSLRRYRIDSDNDFYKCDNLIKFKQYLERTFDYIALAYVDDRYAGMLGLSERSIYLGELNNKCLPPCKGQPRGLFLSNLYVDKAFRRMKVGTELISYSIRIAYLNKLDYLFLDCLTSNYRALWLYNKMGFISFSYRYVYSNNDTRYNSKDLTLIDLNDKNNNFILDSIKNKVNNELSRGRYIFNDSYENGTTFVEMIKKLKLTCLSTPDKSISCSIYPNLNVNTCDLVGLISSYSFKDIKKTQKYFKNLHGYLNKNFNTDALLFSDIFPEHRSFLNAVGCQDYTTSMVHFI